MMSYVFKKNDGHLTAVACLRKFKRLPPSDYCCSPEISLLLALLGLNCECEIAKKVNAVGKKAFRPPLPSDCS